MKRILLTTLLGLLLVQPLIADDKHHPGAVEGEIRKVDTDAKKITIKHGEIKNLDMPPMTMVFRVKEEAMLGSVNAGDKVKFSAESVGGQFVVTRIEPAR